MYVLVGTDHNAMLHEMTKSQVLKARRENPSKAYQIVSVTRAHDWVRNGYLHATALYCDMDGRIRRAG